jgi:hypothetical protein
MTPQLPPRNNVFGWVALWFAEGAGSDMSLVTASPTQFDERIPQVVLRVLRGPESLDSAPCSTSVRASSS